MRNYQNGKIYTVRSRSRPDLVYVGSTIQPLSVRMGMHRQSRNDCTSKQIVDIGDAYIELIELYPCSSKEELNRREGHFQRSMDCVNRRIEGRTHAEYYVDNKEAFQRYNEENKEYRAAQAKLYQINNKETIVAQRKQHYVENKDVISEQRRQYYIENKESITERKKIYNAENKEAISARDKKHKEDNKDHYRAYRKQRYVENKDKFLEQRRQYHTENKDSISARGKKYYAAKKEIRTCICGSKYNHGSNWDSKNHYATQKHQAHITLIYAKLNGSSSTM